MTPGSRGFGVLAVCLVALLVQSCGERRVCGAGMVSQDGVCQPASGADGAGPDRGSIDSGPPPDLGLADSGPPPPIPGQVSGTVYRFGLVNNAGTKVSLAPGGYSANTMADGTYTITGVPPGSYDLTATHAHYTTATVNNLTVSSGLTSKAHKLLLQRYRLLDSTTTAIDAGIGAGDKVAFWLEPSGDLFTMALPSGTAKLAAKQIKQVSLLGPRTHLLLEDNSSRLYLLDLGAGATVQLAAKVSGWEEILPGGWLLITTKVRQALYVSPDGNKSYTLTKSFNSKHKLPRAGVMLVLGEDGLYSLPQQGGVPVLLDSLASAVFCGYMSTEPACATYPLGLGETRDQSRVYYFVHRPKMGVAQIRSVGTAAGPAVHVAQLDRPIGITSITTKLFGAKPHLLIRTSGASGGGYPWSRYHVAALAGGKQLLVGIAKQSQSPPTYIFDVKLSPSGNAVACLHGELNDLTLRLVSTDGKVFKPLGQHHAGELMEFNGDGSRLVWTPRVSSGSSLVGLKSVATDGTDLRTHLTDTRSVFKVDSKGKDIQILASHVALMSNPNKVPVKVKVLPYTATSASAAKLLFSCSKTVTFKGQARTNLLFGCEGQGLGFRMLFLSSQAKISSLVQGAQIKEHIAPYYKQTAMYDVQNSAAGNHDWHAANLRSAGLTKMAGGHAYPFKLEYSGDPVGGYNTVISSATTSATAKRLLFCMNNETMALTKGGAHSGSAKDLYAVGSLGIYRHYKAYLDSDLSGTLRLLDMRTCKAPALGSSGHSALGKVTVSLDRGVVLYKTASGLHAAPPAGGKGVKLSPSGNVRALANKALYFADMIPLPHTGSPTQHKVLHAVPLAGGAAVPISASYPLPNKGHAAGDKDLVFSSGGIKYVDMP